MEQPKAMEYGNREASKTVYIYIYIYIYTHTHTHTHTHIHMCIVIVERDSERATLDNAVPMFPELFLLRLKDTF